MQCQLLYGLILPEDMAKDLRGEDRCTSQLSGDQVLAMAPWEAANLRWGVKGWRGSVKLKLGPNS